jgi:serine/threonine protein kinase
MRIYEFFREEDFFYIVSEYCAGGDLMDRIKQGSFDEKETARIMQ